jgi:hypothetical protein
LTIGNAVDQSDSGDVVNIGAGTYREHVVIAKSLTLLGAGAWIIFSRYRK